MAGHCTDENLGIVPIKAIPTFTTPHIINFMDDNPEFASTLDSIVKSHSELIFER